MPPRASAPTQPGLRVCLSAGYENVKTMEDGMAKHQQQRRRVVKAIGTVGTLGALGAPALAFAQATKIKVGFMLPYTGTYAALGRAIANGFKVFVSEQGVKLGGRESESTNG